MDGEGRLWVAGEGQGVHQLVNAQCLSGADNKRVFKVRNHCEALTSYYGRDHQVFFTVTDREGISPKEFAKRWHAMMKHEGDWIKAYLRILEPQRNGRPHFHNLCAVGFDVGPDQFDWEAFAACETERITNGKTARFRALRKQYSDSAAPGLRKLWRWAAGYSQGGKFYPGAMERYGLGRAEILPVRSAGMARYLGKYLEKGLGVRVDDWKGVRRFELDRRSSSEWKRCGTNFSWVSPAAKKWRQRCGELARALKLPDSGDITAITRKLGPRWAYEFRPTIVFADAAEWAEFLAILGQRDRVDSPPLSVPNAAAIVAESYRGRAGKRVMVLPDQTCVVVPDIP